MNLTTKLRRFGTLILLEKKFEPAGQRKAIAAKLALRVAKATVNRIERFLSRSPSQFGESRAGDERLAFVPPLAVSFRVREPDRLVEVLAIGHS